MIIAISGLSGTGKTTIANLLSAQTGLPVSIRWTNRIIRPGEIDGVDYHFTDEISDDEFVGIERYPVANGDLWSYGSKISDVEKDCIMVVNPLAIEQLKKTANTQIIDIMIEVDDDERMQRIILRSDNQSPEEIKRRDRADKQIFSTYQPVCKITNNCKPSRAADLIVEILSDYGVFKK